MSSAAGPAKPEKTEGATVAVVGAGLSGLTAARRLRDTGASVTLFDKARGPGGRLSSRRLTVAKGTDGSDAALTFDHGAQYFTARDDRFQAAIDTWHRAGVVAPWEGRIRTLQRGEVNTPRGEARRFVGTPRMSALTRHLAQGLELRTGQRVVALRLDETSHWWLDCEESEGAKAAGPFQQLILTPPAEQTAALLATVDGQALGDTARHLEVLRRRVEGVELAPCWAAMVAFEKPLSTAFDGAFVEASPLSWVARDSSKPGRVAARDGVDAWVLHAGPEWSREHLEDDREVVAAALLEAFQEAVGGQPLPQTLHLVAHRWRYALPPRPLAEPCLQVPAAGLVVGGDWCGGPRVEGAWLSGRAAAAAVLHQGSDPGNGAGTATAS